MRDPIISWPPKTKPSRDPLKGPLPGEALLSASEVFLPGSNFWPLRFGPACRAFLRGKVRSHTPQRSYCAGGPLGKNGPWTVMFSEMYLTLLVGEEIRFGRNLWHGARHELGRLGSFTLQFLRWLYFSCVFNVFSTTPMSKTVSRVYASAIVQDLHGHMFGEGILTPIESISCCVSFPTPTHPHTHCIN